MANGRFKPVPETTTLQDLADINWNWDKADAELTAQQNDYNGKITAEQQVRASSDSNLQAQITTEQQARITAVSAHINAIAAHAATAITLSPVSGLTASTVQAAVEQLRTMLTTIIAGPAPSAQEILAARMGADGIVRNELGILIQEIHAKLIAANNQTKSLTRGQNLITASEAGPVAVTVKGNTLVNLLGKDGNFEVDSNGDGVADGWVKTDSAQTYTVETATDAPVGSKFQRFTASGGGIGTGVYHPITMVAGRYYIIVTTSRITTSTGNAASVRLSDDSGVQLAVSANATTSTWTHLWIKRQATGEETKLRITCSGGTGSGTLDYDAVRMYEVSAEEYAKVGVDPSLLTGDQINARYPHVDGVKHISNPVITKVGENIFDIERPFIIAGATGSSVTTAVLESPTSLLITSSASAYNHAKHETYPVLPNTTYTLSYKATNVSGVDAPAVSVRKGSDLTQLTISEVAGNISLSFNTGPETSIALNFYGSRATAAIQQKRYENIQLEIGAGATPYEPRNNDYLYALTTLAGYGGINDVLTVRGTEATVLRRWKTDVVLDGSMGWTLVSDHVGFKRVFLNTALNAPPYTTNAIITNHKGVPLGRDSDGSGAGGADKWWINSTSLFVLALADADTGWGEDYSPLPEERKAPFLGYKMNNGTFGTPYNGTGTRTWTRWDATSNTGAVTTVPTTMAEGYIPYKLSYQLATPVTEVVQVEGSLANHAGVNLYEVGEGVIMREKVVPKLDTGLYTIIGQSNSPGYWGAALTSYRSNKLLTIYKNKVKDAWTIGSAGIAASIRPEMFDSTAEYTVTYIALDKYLLTAPVVEGALEYNTSSKMVQDTLVQRMADMETVSTINVNAIAELYRRVRALGGV